MPRLSLRWLLAELSVVVLGILVAFQVDEWNTRRLEREEESRALDGIVQDLQAERAALESRRASLESQRDASLALLELLASGAGPEDGQRIAELWTETIVGGAWTNAAPTYQGLRDSGSLHIIQDQQLQRQFNAYFETEAPRYAGNTSMLMSVRDDLVKQASGDIFAISVPEASGLNEVEVFSTWLGSGSPLHIAIVTPVDELPRDLGWIAALGRFQARATQATVIAAQLENSIDELIGSIRRARQ